MTIIRNVVFKLLVIFHISPQVAASNNTVQQHTVNKQNSLSKIGTNGHN